MNPSYTTVVLKIRYTTPGDGKCLQKWECPLRGRKPEEIARDWWRKIKRESFAEELLSVTVEDEDITKKSPTIKVRLFFVGRIMLYIYSNQRYKFLPTKLLQQQCILSRCTRVVFNSVLSSEFFSILHRGIFFD